MVITLNSNKIPPDVDYDDQFKSDFKKIDNSFKQKVKKQMKKIIKNPTNGKPMRNVRKGTREVYVSPYRLSYSYDENKNLIIFLQIYHKKHQ